MNRLRGSSEVGLSTSIKVLINRFSYLFFVLAAFGIMLLSKADIFVVEKVSTIVVDVFSPLMRVVSEPAAAINNAVDRVHELANIREQNVLLSPTLMLNAFDSLMAVWLNSMFQQRGSESLIS